MAKWADKLISEVEFNSERTHLESVRYRTESDEGTISSVKGVLTRNEVVRRLKSGETFATIFESDDGKWRYGASVDIFNLRGMEYIKTEPDNRLIDNLDNLPEF